MSTWSDTNDAELRANGWSDPDRTVEYVLALLAAKRFAETMSARLTYGTNRDAAETFIRYVDSVLEGQS